MRNQLALTPDLFKVCLRYYSQHVASVAASLLYWWQHAEHEFGGRTWFFKTNAELAEEFGKHPKTVQRAVLQVCATVGDDSSEALFIMSYHPKPWERAGRVRYLSVTARGEEMLAAAIELAKARRPRKNREQNAVSNGHQKGRSVSSKRPHRSPQNAPSHINQKNLSESHSDGLSSSLKQREKTASSKEEGFREGIEIERFVRLQNQACHENNKPWLAWKPREVERNRAKLGEFIQEMVPPEHSDEKLLARLKLLTRDLVWLCDQMKSCLYAIQPRRPYAPEPCALWAGGVESSRGRIRTRRLPNEGLQIEGGKRMRRRISKPKPKVLGPRELATCQCICKLDDDALRVAFGLSGSQLASLKSDPGWIEQLQYVSMVETASPLDLATLFAVGHQAAFRAINRVPARYETQMLQWYGDQILRCAVNCIQHRRHQTDVSRI